ncbi:hypothetical protein [Conyzicola sp.]|uniref:hypothetical protein n=1 Tax=Conyzicola sp. TaxID=1969404 RepID=UPI0039898776
MKTATPQGWPVTVPPSDTDPYLAAALWLIEKGDGALIVDRPVRPGSIHARILLESVPVIDARPRSRAAGLAVVLVTPAPETLERLDRFDFDPSTEWMLIPSGADSADRAFQDAWLWAMRRPSSARLAGRTMPHFDLSALLTPPEVWALAVRSGIASAQLEALRAAASSHLLY